MRLCLIGFLGAGKSVVASELAGRNGIPYFDTDELVVSRSGMRSVSAIFEKYGETFFRRLEREVCSELSSLEPMVISTGGGAVLDQRNVANLRRGRGVFIYLTAAFETICQRIGDGVGRPLFENRAVARKLFDTRVPEYEAVADYSVCTEERTPAEIADQVLTRCVGLKR